MRRTGRDGRHRVWDEVHAAMGPPDREHMQGDITLALLLLLPPA